MMIGALLLENTKHLSMGHLRAMPIGPDDTFSASQPDMWLNLCARFIAYQAFQLLYPCVAGVDYYFLEGRVHQPNA